MAKCVHGEWYVGNGNMVCGRGCEQHASDIIARLEAALAMAQADLDVETDALLSARREQSRTYDWIVRRFSYSDAQQRSVDHACAQCVPGGPLVRGEFVCVYHAAKASVEERAPVSPSRQDGEVK